MADLTKKQKKELDALRHHIHTELGPISTLREILERAGNTYGDRTAVVEKVKKQVVSYTMNEFRDEIYAVGTALIDMGFQGKHIAIVSENSFHWIVAFFAITCMGSTAVPIDKELSDETISTLITKSDSEAVFCSRTYYDTIEKHMANDSRCTKAFAMYGNKCNKDNFMTMEALTEKGKELIKNGDKRFIDAKVNGDDMAAILFTSGTTGANKGVMLSHYNFASNVDGIIENIDQDTYSSFSILPMNHAYELSCNIFTSIYMNAVIYINDSLKNILPNIGEFRPDAMAVVPLVLEGIFDGIWSQAEASGKAAALHKLIDFSNKLMDHGIDLRNVLFKMIRDKFGGRFQTMSCGGAPSRIEHIKCLSDIGFRIYSGYGLTEASPTVTLNINGRDKPLSAGFAFPKAQYKIVDPDKDGVGEIWIKGENITKGYYKDEEATKASFNGEWFMTGDYGRVDNDGELYVVGRKKNLIILANGENIYPETVESYVMEKVRYVHEVVAFEEEKTIRDKKQVVMAVAVYVEPKEFPGKTEEEIIKMTKDDVLSTNKGQPSYRKFQDVYVSLSEFEKNSTRKVIRQKVIDTYTKSKENV